MKKNSILIVDDSSFVRKQLKTGFEKMGFIVYEAEDGEAVFRLIKDIEPDIISLDYQMPKMNGAEVCMKLRQIERLESVPIYMLTSLDNEGIKLEAFEAGVTEFFNKDNLDDGIFAYIKRHIVNRKRIKPKVHIVFVEDSSFMVSICKNILQSLGYAYSTFCMAEECLDYFKQGGACDLLLLDINLPQMSGLDFIKYIRKEMLWDDLPIIVMSGSSTHTLMVETFLAGANDYIAKPFQGDEFIVRIEAHLKSSQLRQELKEKNERLEYLNQALEKSKTIAEEANKVKSAFLAQASHDLRTPLHVVNGILDSLLHYPEIKKSSKLYKPLQIAFYSGEKQLELVNNILDLSKIETNTIPFEEKAFDLSALLKKLPFRFEEILKEKTVEFIIANTLQSKDCLIKSDEKRLNQVLVSLINNAIKFTDKGYVRLDIHLSKARLNSNGDGNGQRLYFELTDTGAGISKEDQERIFNPFQLGVNQPLDYAKGIGLGLSLCKGIVNCLGGEISVASKLGKGSLFTFWIPYKKVQKNEFMQDHQVTSKVDYKFLESKYALVVDDDEFSCAFAQMIMQGKLKNDIAKDAKQALDLVQKNNYDLVLLDVVMPGMDGKKALLEIKALKPQLPVIAVTARNMKGDCEEMLAAGFDAYLAKPFKEEELFLFLANFFKKLTP